MRPSARLTTSLARLRQRAGFLMLVGALSASVLAVGYGTGYQVSRAALSDGSTWLPHGHRVVHFNGESGRPDAKLVKELATGRQRLEVVQHPDTGDIWVVNAETDQVTRIDGTHVEPKATWKDEGEPQVVSGPKDVYVADSEDGTVDLMDRTGGPMGSRRVNPPGGVDAFVVDGADVGWALSHDVGQLHRIVDGKLTGSLTVSDPGERAHVTLVGGKPVIVRPGHGDVIRVTDDLGLAEPIPVPVTDRAIVPNVPKTPGAVLWLVLRNSGELLGVDLETGKTTTASVNAPAGANLAAPVVYEGQVYVPDYTNRMVYGVNMATMRPETRVGPIPGRDPTFEVKVDGGKLWIKYQNAEEGVVIDAEGRQTELHGGDGRGVDDGRATPPEEEPAGQDTEQPQTTATPKADTPKLPQAEPDRPPSGGSSSGEPRAPDTGADERPQPQPVRVPDVVGMVRDAACDRIRAAELNCAFAAAGESPWYQPDEVIETDPTPGTRVPKGRIVTIRYSGPQQPRTVPDVGGLDIETACQQLATSGLVCGREPLLEPVETPAETGTVTEQDPPAGEVVEEGSTVTVRFHDKVRVPNVVGQLYDTACQQVQQRGFQCARADAGSPQGTGSQINEVAHQDPGGDSGALPGSTVTLHAYNNTGTVPQVAGMELAVQEACNRVAAAGYTCQTGVRDHWSRPDIAHSQEPGPGAVHPLGADVWVYYENTAPQPVYRYRRSDGSPVWVIRVGENTGGLSNYVRDPTPLGWAIDAGSGNGFTKELHDWTCRNCWGYQRNHHINNGGQPAGFDTDNGLAGFAFKDEYDGSMRELVRLKRTDGGFVAEWAYATRWDGQWDGAGQDYIANGFREEQSLGWIWPP